MNMQGDLDNYEAAWSEGDKPAAEAEAMPAAAADDGAKDKAEAEYSEAFHAETPAEPVAKTDKREPSSFAEAFAMHRKAGDATFEWQGKKFTTKLASDKPKAAAAKSVAKPAATKAAPMPKGNTQPSYTEFADRRDAAAAPKVVRSDGLPVEKPKRETPLMERIAGEGDAMLRDAATPLNSPLPTAKAKPAFDDGTRYAGAKIDR